MNWITNNLGLLGDRTLDHLALAVPAIILSFVLSIPIGWFAHRYRWARGTLLSVCALFYAIPSLVIFIVIPLVIGTGLRAPENVVIALTLYGMALMVRSTADGFGSVDPAIIQSATAMGYSSWRRFWAVELPLAGPVLLAGIRVVAVSTVSLVTVAAILGVPNLGQLFVDGLRRQIYGEIWAGIVLTIALAFAIDLVITIAGRLLMPWVAIVASGAGGRTARTRTRAVTA